MKFQSKLPNVGTTIFTVMSSMANEYGAINLSQGFPDFDPPKELRARINYHLQHGKNQYAPMQGVPELRKKVAEKMNRLYGAEINYQTEINITAGGTQAIFTAIQTFVREGEEVILIEPCFDCYVPAIEMIGAKVVAYQLHKPDYRVDWEEFKYLITDKTRMIIINTPHNPIGKTLKEADLKALEQITQGSDMIVLSDEVYEHIIFDGQEHQSALRFPDLWQRSLALFSFGKTYHATGWKIGYCIAPAHLMAEFRKVHQFNVFTVNTFVQYGLCDYLDVEEHYLNLPDFYQKKRDFFNSEMKGSSLESISCEGTYFQLYDYSAISDKPDMEFCEWLTREAGVAAIPVSVFNSNGLDERVIRLCFAKRVSTLEEGARLLKNI